MAEFRKDRISETENVYNSNFNTDVKKILDNFKSITFSEKLGFVSYALSLIPIIIKNFFELNYSYAAEKFYGVPKHYFYSNPLGDPIMILIFLAIFLIMLLLPYILYNFFKWKIPRLIIIFLSFNLNLFYLYVTSSVIVRLAEIFNVDLYNTKFLSLPIDLYIFLLLMTLIIVSIFVHIIHYPFTNAEYFEDVKKTNHENDNKNKIPIHKRIIPFFKNFISIGIRAILIIFPGAILLFSMFLLTDITDPSAKKSYEVVRLLDEVTQKEIDYFVVGYYKDNAILSEIYIDEYNHAFFEKNRYTIMPLEGEEISYTTFSNVDHK